MTTTASKMMRRANREAELIALRDGRRTRSATFTNRKKEANRNACRNKAAW